VPGLLVLAGVLVISAGLAWLSVESSTGTYRTDRF
jgi:hypothetical protein